MTETQPPPPSTEAPPSPFQMKKQAETAPPPPPPSPTVGGFMPPASSPAPIWEPAPPPPPAVPVSSGLTAVQLQAAADAARAIEEAQAAEAARLALVSHPEEELVVESPPKVNLILRLWSGPGSWVDIDIDDTESLRCPPGWFEVAEGHAIRVDAWTRMELIELDL